MKRLFVEHPASVGETYLEHLRFATKIGTTMLRGGLATLVHGILPFLFVTTGSRLVFTLAVQINDRRQTALARRTMATRSNAADMRLTVDALHGSLTSASL